MTVREEEGEDGEGEGDLGEARCEEVHDVRALPMTELVSCARCRRGQTRYSFATETGCVSLTQDGLDLLGLALVEERVVDDNVLGEARDTVEVGVAV